MQIASCRIPLSPPHTCQGQKLTSCSKNFTYVRILFGIIPKERAGTAQSLYRPHRHRYSDLTFESSWFGYQQGQESLSSSERPYRPWYSVRTRALFPGIKRSGREAYHLPPSNADVQNVFFITALPHISSYCAQQELLFVYWLIYLLGYNFLEEPLARL